MKKLCTATAALSAVVLMAIPAQSQAFFGFFGGGFSFGFGGGGWGGPGYGYGGPGYWRRGYWGHPGYRYGRWRHPYFAYRGWGLPYYGYPYFHHLPVVATMPALPAVTTVRAPEVRAK